MSASASLPRKPARLDGVDALRGVAIFFVVMNHVNMRLRQAKVPYTAGLPDQLVSSLVWNGQFGVQIFFAVSGFLITSTALRRWDSLSRLSVRDFYKLRFARIAPLLILLLTGLSIFHLVHLKNFIVPSKTGGLGRALLAALTFHVNVLEARRGYLPANWDILWSLSVEEMFYLFFPLICRLLRSTVLFVAVLMIFVGLGPFGRTVWAQGNEVWREYSYLGSMDAIALGCLTALLVSRVRFSPTGIRTLAVGGTASLALILGFTIQADKWGLERTGLSMTIIAVGACMLIIVSAQTRWTAPAGIRTLLSTGEHSYEIYLTHMFVVFAFFEVFLRCGKPLWAVPLLFIATLLTAVALGKFTARAFSEPVNSYLRKRWGQGRNTLAGCGKSLWTTYKVTYQRPQVIDSTLDQGGYWPFRAAKYPFSAAC